MNESTPWILEDEPPPPLEEPRFELPRLQIIHLMMWMAATAAAFVPYRVQLEQLRRLVPAAAAANNPVATVSIVWGGLLQGAMLFVAGAMLVWRRRGYRGATEPGHYFAYQGAAFWAVSLLSLAALWLQSSGRPSPWLIVLAIPQLAVAIVFFVWFLRLARRDTLTPVWRWAFGIAAIAPVGAWVLMMGSMFIGLRTPFTLLSMTCSCRLQPKARSRSPLLMPCGWTTKDSSGEIGPIG